MKCFSFILFFTTTLFGNEILSNYDNRFIAKFSYLNLIYGNNIFDKEKINNTKDELKTIAILNFQSKGVSEEEAATLTHRFSTEVFRTNAVRLVERELMVEILKEQGFQQSGCVSNECVVEIGALLGVQQMISGSIGRVGDTYTIDIELISVQTGEIINSHNLKYKGQIDGLIIEIEILVWEFFNLKTPEKLIKERNKQSKISKEIDTIIFKDRVEFQSFNGKPLLRSLVLPGWGQMYNKSPRWKTALFAGIEVVGIVGIVQLNKKAENLRIEFESFADEHWDFTRWVSNTPLTKSQWLNNLNIPDIWNYNEGDTTMYDVIIDGTHQLDILYNGQIKSSDCFNDDNTDNNCIELDQMQVIRDLHFYENIGKYDQFVGGWDDLVDATNDSSIWWIKEKHTEDGTEILLMTKNKEKYLDMRYKSNTYLKMATYAVSAVMFNHVISALEAVWTSHSDARKKKIYETSIGLFYNKNTQYGIGGLSLGISW